MIFISIILLGIIIGYPIWDYNYMKYGDFSNKPKMYMTIMIPQWSLVAILFIYWLMTKRSWNDLYTIKPVISSQIANMKSFGIGVASAIIILFLLSIFSKKLKKKIATWIQEQTESIHFMLPTTVFERILFVLVAITAGFCEETIFRGVMLYYLEHFPIQMSVVAMIVIAGLLYGIVHSYQGLKGIVATGYVGAILFYIYITTGNLWICIFLHFLIDVKFAFTPNKNVSITENNIDEQLINKQL